jgi:hypothetical protein
MRPGFHSHVRRSLSVAAVGILALALTACTGRGGGQLPPDRVLFKGPASFGFAFSCEDTIDPVLESAICIGQNPPPGGNELIFLGRYRLLSSAPAGFPSTCPARETRTTPLCRFEVIVRDNDMNHAPSPGDYFQITLSSGTVVDDELDPATVFYTRAGLLSSGNLTVD